MKKVLVVILSIYLSIIIFMPKEQLIYTGLNKLNFQKINFEVQNTKDMFFYEDIDGLTIIYDQMKVAKIENIKVFPFIFYNFASISSIRFLENFSSMIDLRVYSMNITYSIFTPFTTFIKAETSIGKIKGEYDLKNSTVKFSLKPNKNFNNFKFKRYFKKQKGGYIYATKI